MILQKSPTPVSCLVTAFAMAIGVSVEELVKKIGHDGQVVAWPDRKGIDRFRGYHVQEIIEALRYTHYSVVQIDACPTIELFGRDSKPVHIWTEEQCQARINSYLECRTCVICGIKPEGYGHAVAWEYLENKVYDPEGRVYGLEDLNLTIKTLYIINE